MAPGSPRSRRTPFAQHRNQDSARFRGNSEFPYLAKALGFFPLWRTKCARKGNPFGAGFARP